ncbi:hypothetical protein ACS0PU_006666 [Formica fusca]
MGETRAVGERTKERKHVREKDATRDRSMTNARQLVQTMVRAVCARTSIEREKERHAAVFDAVNRVRDSAMTPVLFREERTVQYRSRGGCFSAGAP